MNAAAKVGLFFLLAILISGVLIFKIEDWHIGQHKRQTVRIVFTDASGLDNKAVVRVAGVRVGEVTAIRLVEGRAYVTVALDNPDVELRDGASAAIGSQGLLGEKFVELIPGNPDAPKLPANSVLTGGRAISFDEVTKLARDIALDIKDVTSSLREGLGGPEGARTTKAIVQNIEQITENLREIVADNRANVNETVANLREFSKALISLTQRVDNLVAANTGNTTASISNIKDLTAKLEHTADNLNDISDKINTGKGTVGQLINSDETSKNLNEALVSVKEGVGALNKTIGKVGKWGVDLGLRSEYLAGSSKFKSYLTVDLVPAPDHFYRFEATTEPFGLRTLTTKDITVTYPDGHQETYDIQTEQFADSFALSALFGFNLGPWTLRGGLEESRGGLGVDYSLWDKHVRLSADMWDFGRDGYKPHAKIGGRVYISPAIFATVGWDDFLNRRQKASSVFIGGGVRWSDDDVKLLLSSVPIK